MNIVSSQQFNNPCHRSLTSSNSLFNKNNCTSDSLTFKALLPKAKSDLIEKNVLEFTNASSKNLLAKFRFREFMKKVIPSIMDSDNFINSGMDAKVFRISDNFVFKVNRLTSADKVIGITDFPSCPNSKFKNLDFYYGAPLVKLGKSVILKNATSNNNYVICGGYTDIKDLIVGKPNYEYLLRAAKLPQESYDNFANGLKKLNNISSYDFLGRKYYTPDTINPNNFLISGEDIRVVDDLDKTFINESNTTLTMLDALLVRHTPMIRAEFEDSMVKPRREIMKKIFIAGEKVGLPFDNDSKHFSISDSIIREITTVSPLELIKTLKHARETKMPLEDRIKLINASCQT